MTEREEFGKKVKAARLEKNMNQETLAEKLGVSRDTILRLEKGRQTKYGTDIDLCRALEKTPNELYPASTMPKTSSRKMKMNFMFDQLNSENQEMIMSMMELYLQQQQQQKKN